MIDFIKKLFLYSSGVGINLYFLAKAIEANDRWNKYLNSLSPEQREALEARDWYLKKQRHGYGSGVALELPLERLEQTMYDSKTAEEKEKILTIYRWQKIKSEKYSLSKRENNLYLEHNQNSLVKSMTDGAIGAFVGYFFGSLVAFPEYIKIYLQIHRVKHVTLKQAIKIMCSIPIKNINSFALAFGGACVTEFYVIKGIKEKLKNLGCQNNSVDFLTISAAAISTAAWLTLADHTLLRHEKFRESPFQALKKLQAVKLSYIFSGYTPMVIREFLFLSVHYILAGRIRREIYNRTNSESSIQDYQKVPKELELYKIASNIIAGVPACIMTQPFDVCKTVLQLQVAQVEKPSLRKAIKTIIQAGFFKGAMRGLSARLPLAAFGGTAVENLYAESKESLDELLRASLGRT